MHTCPVCGFDKLWEPAEDDFICPSCGTQFGYTDANRTHSQLRQRWIENGKQWYSPVFPKPLDFNADFQLQKLLQPKREQLTEISVVLIDREQLKLDVRSSDYGQVVTYGKRFIIGNSGIGTGRATTI